MEGCGSWVALLNSGDHRDIQFFQQKESWGGELNFKNSFPQGGVQFSCEIILGGYSFHTSHFSDPPPPQQNSARARKSTLNSARATAQRRQTLSTRDRGYTAATTNM